MWGEVDAYLLSLMLTITDMKVLDRDELFLVSNQCSNSINHRQRTMSIPFDGFF